jgi:hypothetical protein
MRAMRVQITGPEAFPSLFLVGIFRVHGRLCCFERLFRAAQHFEDRNSRFFLYSKNGTKILNSEQRNIRQETG